MDLLEDRYALKISGTARNIHDVIVVHLFISRRQPGVSLDHISSLDLTEKPLVSAVAKHVLKNTS